MNREKYIKERINEIRLFVNEEFKQISKLNNRVLKINGYFSIIDSFAQSYNDYKKGYNSTIFCDFVMKFQKKYNFLKEVDPITLAYDLDIEEKEVFSMIDCGWSNKFFITDIPESIRDFASKNIENEKYTKHTYIRLLYQLRNKCCHEMNNLNGNKFEEGQNEIIPFYSAISVYFNLRKKPREIIQLTFPLKFIRTLFKDAINNYLLYCENELIDPFENNNTNRKMYKTWYD